MAIRPLRLIRHPLTALALTLIAAAHAGAQEGPAPPDPPQRMHHYVHGLWDQRAGYPGGEIAEIAQTPDGYLWVATDEGVVRFDGVTFTHFSQPTTAVFTTGVFTAAVVDGAGTLWLGSQDGLYSYRDRAFARHSTGNGLPDSNVTALTIDHGGDLVVGTRAGGAGHYRGRVYTPIGDPTLEVSRLYMDRSGLLWIVDVFGGVTRVGDGQEETFELPRQFVHDLTEDNAGRLWGAMAFGFHPVANADTIPRPEGVIPRARRVLRDSRGTIWIGSETAGLFRVRDGIVDQLSVSEMSGRPGIIGTIYEDRSGAIWVGGGGGQLHRFSTGAFTTYTEEDGLAGGWANNVLEDHSGVMWVGSLTEGLSRIENGVVTRFGRGTGLPAVLISSIFEDRDDNLWVVVGGRLGQFRDEIFAPQREAERAALGGLHRPAQGSDGRIWFANRGRAGVTYFDGSTYHPFSGNAALSETLVSVLLEDRGGGLWIGTTSSGLFRYSDGSLTAIEGVLGSASVAALHESAHLPGVIWAGTIGGGLFRITEGGALDISRSAGLATDIVHTILEDDLGTLWLGTSSGVTRVALDKLEAFARGDVSEVTSVEFGVRDGLKARGVTSGSPGGWKASDGRLWFATSGGVSVVDPSNLHEDRSVPNPVIAAVLADGIELGGSPISLPAGRRDLEFRFAIPGVTAPTQARVRYMLDGYDREWSEAGNRKSAFYTQLPHGSYRFRVSVVTRAGVSSQTDAVFSVSVAPFFYETAWFLVLTGLLAGGLLLSLHRLRLRASEQRQAQLEGLSHQLLSAQEDERGRLARALHDELGQSMTAVHLNLQVLEGADSVESVQERAKDSMSIIDRLLQQIRTMALDLRPPMLDDLGLVAALDWYFARQTERSGVTIDFDSRWETGRAAAATETACFRIAQEALTNVLRHSGASSVRVALEEQGGSLVLEIVDDGVGFDPTTRGAIRRRVSMGVTGMEERAALAGGVVLIESSVGTGTKVRATFPLPA